MTKMGMGTITEGYETNMIIDGFDFSYEIIETDSGVTNTFDNLEDFAEQVLLIINPMGYYRLKIVAKELLKELAEVDREKAKEYCKTKIYEDELEFIGGDEI